MQLVMNRVLLPIIVFLTGACVLIVEVVATRILSPYFGNTIFSISSVISVILAALSIGYYVGGRLADRKPELRWFFSIILVSGLVLLALHTIGQTLLPIMSPALPITTGPLLVSLSLFFLPATLLGMLSPYAIKLQQTLTPERGIGNISGTMFFWSTVGSICGSLSAGFYFIPHVGINEITVGTSVALFFIGLLPMFILSVNRKTIAAVAIIFALLFASTRYTNALPAHVVYDDDGVYERLRVVDVQQFGRPTRMLLQDSTFSGSIFLDSDDPTDLVFEYAKYASVHHEVDHPIERALVIGGGSYTVPQVLLHELPETRVDVVEIEPELFTVAQTYFRAKEDPRLTNMVMDGRRYLSETDARYDFIFADAYGSLYSVPSHLATQEFFQLAHDRLTDHGLFLANFIGDMYPNEPSIIFSAMKTFESVFDLTYYFATRSPSSPEAQNIMFLGVKDGQEITFDHSLFTQHLIDRSAVDLSDHATLTDNFAPVEFLSAQILKRQTCKISKRC